MKSKLLNDVGEATYAIVFETSEEVIAGHFTAIGALSKLVLGYFDWRAKEYTRIPVHSPPADLPPADPQRAVASAARTPRSWCGSSADWSPSLCPLYHDIPTRNGHFYCSRRTLIQPLHRGRIQGHRIKTP